MRVTWMHHQGPWTIVDCEVGRCLKHVRWADDETHEYATIDIPATRFALDVVERVHRVRRVWISLPRWLVLINPVGDPEESAREAEALHSRLRTADGLTELLQRV